MIIKYSKYLSVFTIFLSTVIETKKKVTNKSQQF